MGAPWPVYGRAVFGPRMVPEYPWSVARTIYLCLVCEDWTLDAGRGEPVDVVTAIMLEHMAIDHGAADLRAARDMIEERLAAERAARIADVIRLDVIVGRLVLDLSLELDPWRNALGEVLSLHRLIPDLDRPEEAGCAGCDAGDYAEGPAAWPCRTLALVLRARSRALPTVDADFVDAYRGGKLDG